MTTTDTGGLVGWTKGAFASAVSSANNHDAWAIRLVFIAGLATIIHKSGIEVPRYAVIFGICLGVAALLYEMNAATSALRAFWKGRPLSALGWSFIWLIAFGYSMNQWIGAASVNEAGKSGMQKAAFVKQEDTSKTESELTVQNNDLLQRISMAPKRTAEQAQAAIDNAKANRFWASTTGCTETKGPQTRAFCDAYASAVADRAGATALIVDREEQKQIAIKLNDIRSKRDAMGSALASGERDDLIILTRYAGMKQADAQALNALGSIVAISIFLSFASMLKELEHLRAAGPRAKLFSTGQFWFKLRRAILGGKADTYIIDDTKTREAAKQAFARYGATA